MNYKIFAQVEADHRDGYSVYDWFEGDVLDCEYETTEEAEKAAMDAYKGLDVDGIGCSWQIA